MLQTKVSRYRFTVEEFHKMGEASIFGEDDRVELVGGEVVEMTPIGWRHIGAVNAVNDILSDLPGREHYTVSVQNPLVLDDYGEHQPDVVLLRRNLQRGLPPAAGDALLVVEVADTSLRYDREVKMALYARAGIVEAWLVNLVEEMVEVHSEPSPGGYGVLSRFRSGEEVFSATIPRLSFEAARILPPKG